MSRLVLANSTETLMLERFLSGWLNGFISIGYVNARSPVMTVGTTAAPIHWHKTKMWDTFSSSEKSKSVKEVWKEGKTFLFCVSFFVARFLVFFIFFYVCICLLPCFLVLLNIGRLSPSSSFVEYFERNRLAAEISHTHTHKKPFKFLILDDIHLFYSRSLVSNRLTCKHSQYY